MQRRQYEAASRASQERRAPTYTPFSGQLRSQDDPSQSRGALGTRELAFSPGDPRRPRLVRAAYGIGMACGVASFVFFSLAVNGSVSVSRSTTGRLSLSFVCARKKSRRSVLSAVHPGLSIQESTGERPVLVFKEAKIRLTWADHISNSAKTFSGGGSWRALGLPLNALEFRIAFVRGATSTQHSVPTSSLSSSNARGQASKLLCWRTRTPRRAHVQRSRSYNQCGNTRSGLVNNNEEVGSKRESEREEVRCEAFHYQEESRPSEELHEDRKLSRTGLVPARVWGGQAVGISPADKVEVEAADGGRSRQEGIGFRCHSSWK